MFQAPQLFISYKYYEAKTPEQLQILMLQIQVSAGVPINFTPPIYVKDKWITWALHDYSKDIRPQDKLKMGNK